MCLQSFARYDLSDLVDRLLWLIAHDAEAKIIAQNGLAFAHRRSHSAFRCVCCRPSPADAKILRLRSLNLLLGWILVNGRLLPGFRVFASSEQCSDAHVADFEPSNRKETFPQKVRGVCTD